MIKKKNDERGLSEIQAYDDLEIKFANDELFFPLFRIRSSLIRLRSSGHMSYNEFLKYAKSEKCKNMINRNLTNPFSFESMWYHISPRSYYVAIHIFFKYEYYRDGRIFFKEHRWYNGALTGWK